MGEAKGQMRHEDIANQIEEQIRKPEIDALVVQIEKAGHSRIIAVLLMKFINFPTVTEAVTKRLAWLSSSVINE